MARAARGLIPFTVAIGVACAIGWTFAHYQLSGTGFEWVFPGMAIGAIAAYFGQIRTGIMIWPIFKRLLRPEEIKGLLAEDEAGIANGEALPRQAPIRPARAAFIGVAGALVLVGGFIAYAEGMKAWHDPTRNTPGKQVKVFTTRWCGPCKTLKAHLRKNAIPFDELDVEKSAAADWGWEATGSRGVPVTVIDNRIYRGANLARVDAALISAGHVLLAPSGIANSNREEGPVSPLKR